MLLFYCIRAKRGENFSILFDSIPFYSFLVYFNYSIRAKRGENVWAYMELPVHELPDHELRVHELRVHELRVHGTTGPRASLEIRGWESEACLKEL